MFDVVERLRDKFLGWILRVLAEDPRTCEHEWFVMAAVTSTVSLDVQCVRCQIWGIVRDPSKEEWANAFGAMENPYEWPHKDRVEFTEARE